MSPLLGTPHENFLQKPPHFCRQTPSETKQHIYNTDIENEFSYGIVEGRVHLRDDDSSNKGEGIIDNTMHLRNAA